MTPINRHAFHRAILLACVVTICLGFVSRAQGQGLPAGWNSLDIGTPGLAGSGAQSGGTWTVKGGGADVWGTGDQFQFTSEDFSGDGAIIARVASVQNTGTYAKAGVMWRGGTAAGADYAFMFVTPGAAGFECRNVAGGTSFGAGSGTGTAPRWVKLTRVGGKFAGYVSGDGVSWTQIGAAQSLVIPTAAKAGLAVCANNNAALNTSTFTDVSDSGVSSSRVNLAKYQSASADSGSNAQFATDGSVGTAWQSSGAGPHWLAITLPLAMQLGSAQLYLGSDDTGAPSNFSLQYNNGTAWVDVPGAVFAGNTATVRNVAFTSAVTASQVRLYSTDASLKVREIALFATSQPIGADVALDLARKRTTAGSSASGSNYAKNAVDGFLGGDSTAWKTANVNGAHSIAVDLGTMQRVGSAHFYSGSASAAAVANFRLQYWTGTTWFDIPGGVVSGNTQKDLAVTFSAPVSTSQVLLLLTDNGTQTVRELAVFPASTGITSFPLGTGVTAGDPPTTKWDDLGDNFWKLINRQSSSALVSSATGTGLAVATSTDAEQQYQVLYNIDSDTYRLRNRATGRCLGALATTVAEADYHAMPHQLWRIVDAGGGYAWFVNVASGLVLASNGSAVTLASASTDTAQQWQLSFFSTYPKKGVADYAWEWSKLNAKWNYDWTHDPFGFDQPADSAFSPMQWGTAGIEALPQYYGWWHAEPKPIGLMGFNEPDFPNNVGGSDVPVGTAIGLWPQLEAMDLPLVSPAPAITYSPWENDFFGGTGALGYRVDFTGVHWYGQPDAGALIAHLANIYGTYGRPVWLTEFSTVDWSNTATWSEEDNYRFMAEFMWLAEDQWWLKRYSIFPFHTDPPANPWDRSHPMSAVFTSAGVRTAVGDVYAGWDGDRTVRNDTPYILHGKGASFHLGNNGAVYLGTIRENGADMQWALVPTTWNAYVVHLVSLRDGRMLRSDGAGLDLAPASTTGAAVEWTYTHLANGYFVLNHQLSGKRLRMNRSNDGNGAPTGTWLTMDTGTAGDDFVQFRFLKPAAPADIADLPAGWNAQDIGSPQQRGSAFFDSGSGVWTVGGGGADISGTRDQFQFVSEGFAGDGTLLARAGSIQGTDPYAKAGVMFRDSAAEDAMFAHVFAGPSTIGFEYRAANGATAQAAAYVGGTAPMWVKIVRTGNTFAGYSSADGMAWTQVGAAQTIAMSTAARAGLAVTAHAASALNTSTFTNVSLLAPGWSDADIGGPANPGGAFFNSDTGVWGVTGGGADIYGTGDQFHFAMRDFAADGSIVARVSAVQNTSQYAKAGVMLRSPTGAGAAYGFVYAAPGYVSFEARTAGGSSAVSVASVATTAPVWLKITRSGASFTGWWSADGLAWTQLGAAQTISMTATPKAGLAVTAHDNAVLNTSTFSNVSLLGTGWSSADIGTVNVPGGTVLDPVTGAWTATASGTDIWGAADQQQFAYQSLTGDGVIVARVNGLANTDPWAKAGVMIRDSTSAGARNAMLAITPGNGTTMQWRDTAGGASSAWGTNTDTAPRWLRLARSGNTFTAWKSSDGATWTTVHSVTLALPATLQFGLALTSHNAAALNTATFDNVTVNPLPAGFSSWAAFQNANFTAAQLANANVSGPLADANGDSLKNLLAYAAGLSPWTGATAANGGLPAAQIQNGFLTLTFTRLRIPLDVSYAVEVTSDLATWNSGPAFTTELSATPLDATREQVTVRDTTPVSGTARRSMRVRTTQTAP